MQTPSFIALSKQRKLVALQVLCGSMQCECYIVVIAIIFSHNSIKNKEIRHTRSCTNFHVKISIVRAFFR